MWLLVGQIPKCLPTFLVTVLLDTIMTLLFTAGRTLHKWPMTTIFLASLASPKAHLSSKSASLLKVLPNTAQAMTGPLPVLHPGHDKQHRARPRGTTGLASRAGHALIRYTPSGTAASSTNAVGN